MKEDTQITQMAGVEVSFTRKSVRNINLRISRTDGAVLVSAPHHASRKLVESFVASRSDWIERVQKRAAARTQARDLLLVDGETIPFLGTELLLSIQEKRGKSSIGRDQNQLNLSIRPDSTQEQRKALLESFYRAELSELLPELLEKWQPKVGASAKECKVRRMKSRWGSCNTRHARIWMSLELIKYPLECIEYVLVHELTHLLEPSHNKRFHRLVGEVMPDWKQHKAILSNRL